MCMNAQFTLHCVYNYRKKESLIKTVMLIIIKHKSVMHMNKIDVTHAVLKPNLQD